MAGRDEIVRHANELLEIERFPEFAPQGLQVVGSAEVTSIACGVSSSRELFETAVELGAELVLVHHGLFWRNEPLVVDARLRGRLEALFHGNASLVAYHLALDAHPTLGNNAQLARRIGAVQAVPFGGVGQGCTIDPVSVDELAARVAEVVGRAPLVLRGDERPIERLAVSTGAAGHDLVLAAHGGARGAERRDRPRARDPPARGWPPRDGALRRPGTRGRARRALRAQLAVRRGREPGLTGRACGLRTARATVYPGCTMNVFGRRAR
jgi:putative NIF3 family GTP cyclohydrolase 1 type 2